MTPTPVKVSRKNIWNFAQNRPILVVRDVMQYFGFRNPDTRHRLLEILLERGVFKWFAVRRDLIKLKDLWKVRLKDTEAVRAQANRLIRDNPVSANTGKRKYQSAYAKGYAAALRECRAEIRALCHSDRWRAPDNDREAQRWLAQQEAG